MDLFKNLFWSQKQRQPAAVDISAWKKGPDFVGALLLLQFFPEERPFLSEAELLQLVAPIPRELRKIATLWIVFYTMWLLRVLAGAKFGEVFQRDIMAAVYSRIATAEDRAPGIDAIADGLKFWFEEMDEGAQDAFRNPVVMKGETIPVFYLFAMRFLLRDASSPFHGSSNPEFDGVDFTLAQAFAEAQDITKSRFDKTLEAAAALPR